MDKEINKKRVKTKLDILIWGLSSIIVLAFIVFIVGEFVPQFIDSLFNLKPFDKFLLTLVAAFATFGFLAVTHEGLVAHFRNIIPEYLHED